MSKSYFSFNKLFKAATLALICLSLLFFSCIYRGDGLKPVYAQENVSESVSDSVTKSAALPDFSVCGKSAYLADADSGTVIYEKNSAERLPIASMVKIMTTLLILEAIDAGKLSLDEDVTVSENAASMGGSQVFLDANTKHKARELIKSIVVASANDSCVALAERVSGSVGGFVSDMNAKAKQLGMNNTNFVNCTGLPAAESFSSAADVYVMLRELIKHQTFFDYSKIWLEDYAHPGGRTTTITNTNKLVRFYNGCDGGKTGFTNEAKFCLAATAKRDNTRVIAVVIGANGSKERFGAVSQMFDRAFSTYSTKIFLSKSENLPNEVAVSGGKQKTLCVRPKNDLQAFSMRNAEDGYEVRIDLPDKIKAPINEGDVIGTAYLTKNGEVVSQTELVAAQTIKKASIFDLIRRIGNKW